MDTIANVNAIQTYSRNYQVNSCVIRNYILNIWISAINGEEKLECKLVDSET